MKRLSLPPAQLLYLLVLVRLLLPFLLQHPVYQPHRDEFLYLDYGRHPDWGYMEVPPLLSVCSWLVQWAGPTIWAVKFFPALFGAATFLLCGHMAIALGGRHPAILLLFLCFVFSAFLRLFHLFQPGFLEVFSWTLIGYCLLRYQQTKKTGWILAFGIACGLGMLSKYTTAFYLAGLAGALLMGGQLSLFRQKALWWAALMGVLIFIPNLWWQYAHRFPVLHHMQELRQTQLQYVGPATFVIDQLLMLLPVVAIWMAGWYATARQRWARPYRWIALQYVLVLALLLLGSAKGYYALGMYPLLCTFGAVHLGKWMQHQHRWKRWLIPATSTLAGLLILPVALPTFPPNQLAAFYANAGLNQSPLFRWEDRKMHPLPQDFADMIGWEELAAITARHYHALPDSVKEETFLYCRGYHTAGLINFYRHKYNLPEAHSDNGSYLLWMPDQYSFRHLMMIGWRMPGPDDEVFNHFRERKVLDSLQLPLARDHGIKLFLFSEADSQATKLAQAAVAADKAVFRR